MGICLLSKVRCLALIIMLIVSIPSHQGSLLGGIITINLMRYHTTVSSSLHKWLLPQYILNPFFIAWIIGTWEPVANSKSIWTSFNHAL